ncbi:hypothetical protein VTJ83DRAFT_5287 [Remersonia thermophila]|uniref:Uncharacterized protein n=1 Tax=Remersonia thermophila TaxID=72144 RepID=A0ABR4D778_9PEZI
MSRILQARLPKPSNTQQQRRQADIGKSDWPLRHLDKLPPHVMSLFPEWLFRPIRRDTIAHSPILAIERLNSQPRPLPEEDKETLVGAVLTMSASLNLALGMLQELLPQEQSRERLGEVLCPTLGQLLASLEKTLPELDQKTSPIIYGMSTTSAGDASYQATPRAFVHNPGGRPSSKHQSTPAGSHNQTTPPRSSPDSRSPWSSSTRASSRQQPRVRLGRFLPVKASPTADHWDVATDVPSKPDSQLVTSLRAEMRVQSAIHVAIESLEFAEGQLKAMRMGGDINLLQKHFYEGYNRLLLRALDLQRQELGSLPGGNEPPQVKIPEVQINGFLPGNSTLQPPSSITLGSPAVRPKSASNATRSSGIVFADQLGARSFVRRNTIQGTRQESLGPPPERPLLKRRMSLAEELAMAAEESESGNQYETSEAEMASSTSELEDSDLESHDGGRYIVGKRGAYVGRLDGSDSDREGSMVSEDRTLDASFALSTRDGIQLAGV